MLQYCLRHGCFLVNWSLTFKCKGRWLGVDRFSAIFQESGCYFNLWRMNWLIIAGWDSSKPWTKGLQLWWGKARRSNYCWDDLAGSFQWMYINVCVCVCVWDSSSRCRNNEVFGCRHRYFHLTILSFRFSHASGCELVFTQRPSRCP